MARFVIVRLADAREPKLPDLPRKRSGLPAVLLLAGGRDFALRLESVVFESDFGVLLLLQEQVPQSALGNLASAFGAPGRQEVGVRNLDILGAAQ